MKIKKGLGGRYWTFVYKRDQVIFIDNKIYEKGSPPRDSVYVPAPEDLGTLVCDYYRYSKPVLKKDGEVVMRLKYKKYGSRKYMSLLESGAKFEYLENIEGMKIAERLEYGEYPHPRRKNMVVIKDGTEIIFYNIKRKNFNKFYDLVVNSFMLIEREKPYVISPEK
jgi:hypothetical protein